MPAVTFRLEIAFDPAAPSTWTDLTSRVAGLKIVRPRGSRTGDASPTTLEVTFRNDPDSSGFCPLTPESAVAAYFPNVAPDRMVRVTALWGASSAVRFLGWVDRWAPDAGDRPPGTATVFMSASCILGRYARRELMSTMAEVALYTNDLSDYYPFDEPGDATRFKGYPLGVAQSGTLVFPSIETPGSAVVQSADSGHLTDGQVEFARGDNVTHNAPVIFIQTRLLETQHVTVFLKLNADPANGDDDILSAYGEDRALLWRLTAELVVGKIQICIRNLDGTLMANITTGAPRDEAWHAYTISLTATNTFLYQDNRGGFNKFSSSVPYLYDPRDIAYLTVGGRMAPQNKGKQRNTFQGVASSLLIQYSDTFVPFLAEYAMPGKLFTAAELKNVLVLIGQEYDAAVGGGTSTTVDLTPACLTSQSRTLLDRWNEITRTVSGNLVTRVDGRRGWSGSADARPVGLSLTLDAEQDLQGGFEQSKEEVPTRITVSSTVGSVDVIDTAAEAATGVRLDGGTIQTAAGSESVMRSVGALQLAGRGSRYQFALDATTTSTDKLTAIMALNPRARVRVTTLPPALTGLTYVDVFASGWDETYDPDSGACLFEFDTDPADDPPIGVFDSSEYGRFGFGSATITGGTCLGNTGTGTVIITTASPMATTAGNFPTDLDWNGERITVSGVAGATSPQTATVTVRGVAPTVARNHSAGEPVDIWHVATFGA